MKKETRRGNKKSREPARHSDTGLDVERGGADLRYVRSPRRSDA
jgi:hypothetical protein